MIYKGYSGTQTLTRTGHSLSVIYLKIQIVLKDWKPCKKHVMPPFRQKYFCTPSKCYTFCLTITTFLIQCEWGTHPVLMRRSFSIYEALIQYLLEGSS